MPKQAETIDYYRFSPKELLLMGVRTERQEEVPIDSIVQEGALIDPEHAQNLAESMMGNRGQISPATLRARLDNQAVVYDVIDGFHRRDGIRLIQGITNEKLTLKSMVLYGCGDEEMFDLRVLAASSVKSIKFARMAEWMKRSFQSTKWENHRIHELVEKEEITLSQVFSLAQVDSSGKILRIEPNEVTELKAWAKKKSKQWARPLSTIVHEMRMVELAAPDLVQRVRIGGGGKSRKGVLTRGILETIVTHLPGDWETQRLLAELAIDRNILAVDLDFLAWSYAQAKEAADQDTMTKIMNEPELLLNPQLLIVHENEPEMSEKTIFQPIPSREEYLKLKRERNSRLSAPVEKLATAVDENKILRKHHVPEIIRALTETILADKGDDLLILHLPGGEGLNLNIKSGLMKLGEKDVELTDRESELMTIFSLLEGVNISDELLSVISPNRSGVSTGAAVRSLKEKIAKLSEEAAQELWLGRKGTYSWLAE